MGFGTPASENATESDQPYRESRFFMLSRILAPRACEEIKQGNLQRSPWMYLSSIMLSAHQVRLDCN